MLKNYFIIAFRNITRNKAYAFINIFGLSIGIACCLLLVLFIRDDLNTDTQHKNIDNLYRIVSSVTRTSTEHLATCSPPLAMAIKEEIPEIEKSLRLVTPPGETHFLIQNGRDAFYETGGYAADSTLFDLFTFDFIEGTPVKALHFSNSVVITSSLAQRLFGNQSALNRMISITQTGTSSEFEITGVIRDIHNSHIHANFFFSMSSPGGIAEFVRKSNEWAGQNFVPTYVLLHDGSSIRDVERKMNDVLKKHGSDVMKALGFTKTLSLEPVKDIYLKSITDKNPRIIYLYVIASLATFILLIACINFVNLSTAKAVKRANEIGVRKVMGAFRSSLVSQFLAEAIVIVVFSIIIGILILLFSLDYFNALTDKHITINDMSTFSFVLMLIILTIVTGLLAGGYPAFYLSSFRPAEVLKGKFNAGKSSGNLRRLLVIFQFMIAIVLTSSLLIISKQLRFIREKDLGFDVKEIIVLPLRTEQDKKSYETLKNQISQESTIASVSGADYLPGHYWNDILLFKPGTASEQGVGHYMNDVDYNFIDVLNVKLVAGRGFTNNLELEQNKIIVNVASASALGYTAEQAIGQKLSQTIFVDASGAFIAYEIIGVMADFHRQSLHEAISPTFVKMRPGAWDTFDYMVIKTTASGSNSTISQIEKVWKEISTGSPFEYSFLDQNLADLYEEDKKASKIISVFTLLAFVISYLGLYALSTFITERRFKEIGMRKVMGASVNQIVSLISKEFIKLVAVAILLASPMAWYLMTQWLQTFAYKTEIDMFVFFYAGAIAILIALFTVGFESLKAAMQNPIKSLRTE